MSNNFQEFRIWNIIQNLSHLRLNQSSVSRRIWVSLIGYSRGFSFEASCSPALRQDEKQRGRQGTFQSTTKEFSLLRTFQEPLLIILLSRHPQRARCVLVIFPFFFFFYLQPASDGLEVTRSGRTERWSGVGMEGRRGEQERRRERERETRGRVPESEGGVGKEERYFQSEPRESRGFSRFAPVFSSLSLFSRVHQLRSNRR